MPPIESITPPSLKNLSIEEENNENNKHKATLWEANIAQNLGSLPMSSSSVPKEEDPCSRRPRGLIQMITW